MFEKGYRKNFIYMPSLGLIDGGDTTEDAMERISRAQIDKEIAKKALMKILERENPNCDIVMFSGGYFISPKE